MGFPNRMKDELVKIAPLNTEINLVAPFDRELDVWKGAAAFSSLSSFTSNWITKEDY